MDTLGFKLGIASGTVKLVTISPTLGTPPKDALAVIRTLVLPPNEASSIVCIE